MEAEAPVVGEQEEINKLKRYIPVRERNPNLTDYSDIEWKHLEEALILHWVYCRIKTIQSER